MAQPQQVEGWPLGLQPFNVRVGLLRNRNFSGSTSFNTLLSASQSSLTDYSSSDLDTESTGTFFNGRSRVTTTLGSLIGISRFVNLSRRSICGTSSNQEAIITTANKNYNKFKPWCFSLCPTDTTDAEKSARTNKTTTFT